MPDRLDILRHQRALAQEQLAWLDREIAALSTPAAPGTPPASSAPSPLAAPPAARASTALPEFPEYQADPAVMQKAARRGCLMYAALAFVLFAGLLAAIYFFAYRDHPLLFSGAKADSAAPK